MGKKLIRPPEFEKFCDVCGRTEKIKKISAYVSRAELPSIVYSIKGIVESAIGKEDYAGRTKPLLQSVLSGFAGIKINAANKDTVIWKIKGYENQLQEVQIQIQSDIRNKGLSEEQKKKKIKANQEKIKEIVGDMKQFIKDYKGIEEEN